MIKKRGDKFVVTNKSGTKTLGTHPTKEKAAKQLAAIEISKAKHMSENKKFKAFRSTLNESEYKETLTGYSNRGIDTDIGPANANLLMKVNAVLNTLSRFTHQHTNEAMVKIRTRLNLFMLDFPWTPWMWQGGMLGGFAVPVTLFGRVDGTSGMAGAGGIRFDGKASPDAGLQEFILSVTVEPAEDGLYRVTAKLMPKVEVMPEGVEEDGDAVTEDYQTPAREAEMKRKAEKHEDIAQRGYQAKMTQSGKAAARGQKQEAKHDAASRRVLKKDQAEQDSPRTYGRGGKVIKRGSRREVKEEIEGVEEGYGNPFTPQVPGTFAAPNLKGGLKPGDKVKVPHKGKMVKGKIVRHDKGGSDKAAQHGGGYVVDVGENSSITVPAHKIVKEGVEQIDELLTPERDAILARERDKATADYNNPNLSPAQQKKAFARAARANFARLRARSNDGTVTGKSLNQKFKRENEKWRQAEKSVKESAGQEATANKVVDNAKKIKTWSPRLDKLVKNRDKVYSKTPAWLKRQKESKKAVKEELIGGQKRLDVNKNKKLDAQDFKLLRAKKKPVQEESKSDLSSNVQSNIKMGKQKRPLKSPLKFKPIPRKPGTVIKEPLGEMSKPKKMLVVNKMKDGKKVSSKLIPAYTPKKTVKEQSVNPEFTTGMPLITPEPAAMPKAPTPKAKKKQSGSY